MAERGRSGQNAAVREEHTEAGGADKSVEELSVQEEVALIGAAVARGMCCCMCRSPLQVYRQRCGTREEHWRTVGAKGPVHCACEVPNVTGGDVGQGGPPAGTGVPLVPQEGGGAEEGDVAEHQQRPHVGRGVEHIAVVVPRRRQHEQPHAGIAGGGVAGSRCEGRPRITTLPSSPSPLQPANWVLITARFSK